MRIAIDARWIGYRRGMGTFAYHLLHAFAANADDDHQFLVFLDDERAAAEIPRDPRFRREVLRPRLYPFWEQVLLPAAVARARCDVLHCMSITAPILPLRAKLVLTLPDAMYLLPAKLLTPSHSLYQRAGRAYRRMVVPRASKRAARIITISHFSKADLQHWLPTTVGRINVTWLAPGPEFRLVEKSDASRLLEKFMPPGTRFIFALGARDPRKNITRVLQAFARLRETTRQQLRLVIAGLDEAGRRAFAREAGRLGIGDRVTFLDFVTQEELVGLYNLAAIFLYPSLYEGFGLPVLEAMACGAPVITSNTTSIPEIAGEAAILIDPLDVPSIAQAIQALLDDDVRRRELTASGLAQAATFSWHRTAAETLQIYREVVKT